MVPCGIRAGVTYAQLNLRSLVDALHVDFFEWFC